MWSPPQLANFDWFKEDYDVAGMKGHGDNWPIHWLRKLKGKLDRLPDSEAACSRFVFDEVLTVPNPRGSMFRLPS